MAVFEVVLLSWPKLVFGPAIAVHEPVPMLGELAARVWVPSAQMDWSVPALAAVGAGSTTIVTSSGVGLVQPEIELDQRYTYGLLAESKPVMVVIGELGAVIAPPAPPEILVQVPVPFVMVLPVMVAVPDVAQMVLSDPALGVVAGLFTVITTVLVEAVHGELAMLQVSVYVPATVGVNTAFVAVVLLNWPRLVFGPAIAVQDPDPAPGVFAANVAEPPKQIVWSEPALDTVGVGFTTTFVLSESVEPHQLRTVTA